MKVHTFDLDLAELDGVATAAAVASGALRPTEVVAAALARAELVEPALNAVVVSDPDRALGAAQRLEMRGGLAAVPTYVKDMADSQGYPTAWGSPGLAGGPVATRSVGIARQFDDMGMVTLGKSSMSEFGFVPCAEPPGVDPTCNPWNTARTTGGSSGGSAALVAAGVVPVAHGADGGGSIRIPAACCGLVGLVGLKPTRGRVLPHREEQLLPVPVTVDGVVTRTVRDTATWMVRAERLFRAKRMPAMQDAFDPLGRRLRVGAMIDLPEGLPVDVTIDEPTRATFDHAVALLGQLGHGVEPVVAPVDGSFGDDFVTYFEMLAFLATRTAKLTHGRHVRPDRFSGFTKGMASAAVGDRNDMVGVSRRLRRTSARMADFHRRYDVLLSPVTSTIAPPLGHLANDVEHRELLARVFSWMPYTPLANTAGTPSISLPLGHDEDTGLPIGAMFSAAHGQDPLLLQLAFELESIAPWKRIGE
ncbi:MAG: amidase [Microthrixaceae bacterium]